MADFTTQLQSALGAAFTIDRELGGGGMSRVFVATENALGRQVVVKVLPAEAAGGSIDRFRREIAMAAKLQHPNIVPLLSAGDMDGVPYYTMPLVEGESLRQRLARHGELSVDETIQVLRHVADALAHAHERGVVHRDIKPENILLTKKHALVVDFGVAKALAGFASERHGHAGADATHGSLTSLGVALGTPAYMSPEQATADPSTDHRADIYALGCVGYEMLTGYPLFSGRSPQATLVAHAAEAPEPILKRRPSTPPVLAELIMRCLEKRPGDRPQSAADVERVLATLATTPGAGIAPTTATSAPVSRVTSRTRLTAAIGGALVLVVTVVTLLMNRTPAVPVSDDVIVVAPFRVSADPSLAYLREGMLDLLSANLTGEGGPRATDARASLAAWRQAGGDGRELTEEEARTLARRLGAAQVLLGSVVGSGSRIVITAAVVGTVDGRRNEVRIEGSVDSLTHLVDQLTAEVLSQGSAAGGQLVGRLASVPLPAVRAWLDGQAAYRRARYDEAVGHFVAALRIDSTFVPATISGAVAASWSSATSLPPELAAAFVRAWNLRSGLSTRERTMITVLGGLFVAFLPPGSVDVAHSLGFLRDSAAVAMPDNPDLLHLVADELFHTGPTRMPREEAHARAAAMFGRILAIDSSYASAYEHLVDVAILSGDTARARWYANRYVALDSLADHADFIRWRLATAVGDSVEQDSIRERFADMSYGNLLRIAGVALVNGLDARDVRAATTALRARASDPVARQVAEFAESSVLAQRGQIAAISASATMPGVLPGIPPAVPALARWSMLAFEDEAAAGTAAEAVDNWLTSPPGPSPLDSVTRYFGACALAQWRLSQRDLAGAERALGELRRHAAGVVAAGAAGTNASREPVCLAMVGAWLAVERGQPDARRLVQHVDSLGVSFETPEVILVVARLWETLGNNAAALRAIRRTPYHHETAMFLPLAVIAREEGRIAALAGDREGAIRAYRRYLAIRVEPDERLKPEVESVRQALARLEREGVGR